MTWQIPWVIAGVDEIPLDMARVFAYAATSGREGVIGSNDLLVSPTATPSGFVSIGPGVFTAVSRFLGASYESYIGRNVGSAVTASVPPTGATSQTQLVYAHVTDPGQSGQPTSAAPIETRVITAPAGVTRLQDVAGYENQSGYALARIDRPANSTTVQASHITDLRFLLEDTVSPIGMVTPFAGNVAPPAWMFCQGQAISRSTYSRLFAAIGTTWGPGDGVATFNLPDMRDNFPRGSSTSNVVGTKGGAATITLTVPQMPPHTHANTIAAGGGHTPTSAGVTYEGSHTHYTTTGGAGGHAHGYAAPAVRTNIQWVQGGSEFYAARAAATTDPVGDHTHTVAMDPAGSHSHGVTLDAVPAHTHTITNASAGSGQAINITPPFLAMNYIIKVS